MVRRRQLQYGQLLVFDASQVHRRAGRDRSLGACISVSGSSGSGSCRAGVGRELVLGGGCLLAHPPVVLLGSEEAVHEDDGVRVARALGRRRVEVVLEREGPRARRGEEPAGRVPGAARGCAGEVEGHGRVVAARRVWRCLGGCDGVDPGSARGLSAGENFGARAPRVGPADTPADRWAPPADSSEPPPRTRDKQRLPGHTCTTTSRLTTGGCIYITWNGCE